MKAMKTLYDVQQFLKQFGILVYMGKRLYDIELMKIELSRIYDAGLMDKLDYLEAEAVLRRAQDRIRLFRKKWRLGIMITWVLWGLIVAMLVWMGYNYLRIRRAAKIVDNAEFESLIRTGQLIDLRDPADFHRKHILGARNIPSNQLKTSLAALRKDKPVLLYENQRAQRVTNAAIFLKKQGFSDIYILSYGLDSWTGKVKTS